MAWKGGDSLKCVRGRRAPGNPEAWIPAEWNGVGAAAWAEPAAARRAARPFRAFAPRCWLTRSAGARCGFSSSSFTSSSSSDVFSSSSSSFCFSSSFLPPPLSPPPPPRPPPPPPPPPLPPGHAGPCRVPDPRRLRRGPLDPEPAAPKLVGQTDRQTRRFLVPSAAPPLPPAAQRLGNWDRPGSSARRKPIQPSSLTPWETALQCGQRRLLMMRQHGHGRTHLPTPPTSKTPRAEPAQDPSGRQPQI
nr:ESX-1 secretion-associated protein EspI-like [Dasypus novemcinctus]